MQTAIGIEAASFCYFSKRYSGKTVPAPLRGKRPNPLPYPYLKISRIKIIQTKPELPKNKGIRSITQVRCLFLPESTMLMLDQTFLFFGTLQIQII